MALTPTESAIMDLFEKGMIEDEIVELGFSRAKVRFTLSTFGTQRRNAASDFLREASIRRGSQQLLEAIQTARYGAGA